MTVRVFQTLRPCVDGTGHRFRAWPGAATVCERCGMTRKEALGDG